MASTLHGGECHLVNSRKQLGFFYFQTLRYLRALDEIVIGFEILKVCLDEFLLCEVGWELQN